MAKRKSGRVKDVSAPKTTRPDPMSRREPEAVVTAAEAGDRVLDAHPDPVDVRDWFYQPSLAPLPDVLVNIDRVPEVLDQKNEGACTGFALAAVVNFLLQARDLRQRVSPRMLYEMARRYDQWPGESYDGSTARGAMIGWNKHGVCSSESWPYDRKGPEHFTQGIEDESRKIPGGAYYRVMHREIRDMHAALNETGILYATLMVHRGWFDPGPRRATISYSHSGNARQVSLPVIERDGEADSGHAVAIVGYTHQGFIVQNSWGPGWGAEGFALLPYEDYMLHATDVWVAQLGVPLEMNTWDWRDPKIAAGLQYAAGAIPLNEIRPYVIDIGDGGRLSLSGEYWTTEDDLRRLVTETIRNRTEAWSRRRVMLYLHGGLNDEKAAARRIVSYRDVLLANEIYPLHVMWETGAMETLSAIIEGWLGIESRAAGPSAWLAKVREGAVEVKDRTLELTASAAGTALWSRMKENARAASHRPDEKGGMQLLLKHVRAALDKLSGPDRKRWEIHLVGHSAGSIVIAEALTLLSGSLDLPIKSVQFLAPAITVAEFKRLMIPLIDSGRCPIPTVYNLSDVGERDDDVGPYGKSLLYLVSNAFEAVRETPLLGMEKFVTNGSASGDGSVDREMETLFKKKVDGRPSLVIAGRSEGPGSTSRSESHGGFDNDPDTLNSVMVRILGTAPGRPFKAADLRFE